MLRGGRRHVDQRGCVAASVGAHVALLCGGRRRMFVAVGDCVDRAFLNVDIRTRAVDVVRGRCSGAQHIGDSQHECHSRHLQAHDGWIEHRGQPQGR